MRRHPWNRLVAWLVDWLCILVWIAATAAVAVPLTMSGVIPDLSDDVVVLNVIALAITIVPVTLAFAWMESRPSGQTLGKRLGRVRVVLAGPGTSLSYGRALVRNAGKFAVPWTIGHAAVFGIVRVRADGDVPLYVVVLTVLAYIVPISFVVSLFVGSGRTPYDRASGTAVTSAAGAIVLTMAPGRA